MTNTVNNTTDASYPVVLFQITYIDSFYCAPTEVVYGETVSAIIRDRTISWMESVGFKGVDVRLEACGTNFRGDLDKEHRLQTSAKSSVALGRWVAA